MTSNTSNSNNARTVRFDVGGTIYKVSRSLIGQYPDTMLSRMVSKTWLDVDVSDNNTDQQNEDPLFIDRDGERFRYVLDYMRDGPEIALPITVSKESLVKDLEYFGFENVNPKDISIRPSCSVYVDALNQMNKLDDELGAKHEYSMLAHYCFVRFKFSGDLEVYIGYHHLEGEFRRENDKKYNEGKKMAQLQKSQNPLLVSRRRHASESIWPNMDSNWKR